MSPRATDWMLALLVGIGTATGLLSLVSGAAGSAWVLAAHGIAGAALGCVTGWKLRRVWRRVALRAWERRTVVGVLATLAVFGTLASGVVWAGGGDLYVGGFNLLNWHIGLGAALAASVLLHTLLRARPLRVRDVRGRRQLLHTAGITAAAAAGWALQRPAARAAGWRGSERRWTGSYERGSFAGNAFPATSWVADRPRPLEPARYQLEVDGAVAYPLRLRLADVASDTVLTATLDCTGGFYSTQHWRGMRLGTLVDLAGPAPAARFVRVVSVTGYRWSFPLSEARDFVLATAVGAEPLSHAHGGPLRLVAPGRRGFQWIKWVVRIELHAAYDYGAAVSTISSSWTPKGTGEL